MKLIKWHKNRYPNDPKLYYNGDIKTSAKLSGFFLLFNSSSKRHPYKKWHLRVAFSRKSYNFRLQCEAKAFAELLALKIILGLDYRNV